MIGLLRGTVLNVDASSALIIVHDVGYEVRMSTADLATLHHNQDVTVYTVMHVAQDALTLFGFMTVSAKALFLQLQKVSGIGPKVALSLLSVLTPEQFMQALSEGNATALAKAPGLGKKGAQKIILELKGSVDQRMLHDGSSAALDAGSATVLQGLMSLGWREADAQQAIAAVCKEYDIALPLAQSAIPQVLKLALSALDRGR